MNNIKISIDTDNAAFDEYPVTETARILRKLANDLESGNAIDNAFSLRDVNGNVVGKVTIT
jgi:hypothetical protein